MAFFQFQFFFEILGWNSRSKQGNLIMMSIRPLTKGIRWLHWRHKAWFPGSLPLNSRFLITDHTPAPGPALHTASLDEPWYWISWNNIRVKVNKESINWSIMSILFIMEIFVQDVKFTISLSYKHIYLMLCP